MAVNKDRVSDLIKSLEIDLNMLEFDESYQYHEPAYFNYVNYYEELIEMLLSLGGKTSLSLFGTYLVGIFAYHVMEQGEPLHVAVKIIINELRLKLQELDATDGIKSSDKKEKEDKVDGKPKYDA